MGPVDDVTTVDGAPDETPDEEEAASALVGADVGAGRAVPVVVTLVPGDDAPTLRAFAAPATPSPAAPMSAAVSMPRRPLLPGLSGPVGALVVGSVTEPPGVVAVPVTADRVQRSPGRETSRGTGPSRRFLRR